MVLLLSASESEDCKIFPDYYHLEVINQRLRLSTVVKRIVIIEVVAVEGED